MGGKYFGDHPERSIYTSGLCRQIESDPSCQGNEGWPRMMGISGKSTATSSIGIGWPYLSLTPPPPGMPVPIPLCPVWNKTGRRAAANTAESGDAVLLCGHNY